MFDEKHYVPILKWKRGEQFALQNLTTNVKTGLTPLIEIVPIPWDYKVDSPARTLDEHLSDTGSEIHRSWGMEAPVFLDIDWLQGGEQVNDGSHPLAFILNDCRQYGVRVVPVTGLDRPSDYQDEVRNAHHQDQLGICVRIVEDDFMSDIGTSLTSLITTLNVDSSSVDLVVDLGYIMSNQQSRYAISCVGMINSLPNVTSWRSITLASTSIPQNLSVIPTQSVGSIARTEWIVWKRLVNQGVFNRIPTFGDYAIDHPEYFDQDPRFITISANVRYTHEDEFVIFRGTSIKRGTWNQMRGLCQQVIADHRFCGHLYSWGDQYIFDCANGAVSTGNAETWRRVGTNHHLTHMFNELANFPWI